MQFIHQPLTWGFFLVLIPLAIHLINLMRRRRVQWAAMDFLLQSYRKHRTWIWLQQLLLLLLRMAAVALLVAMLAQWVTQREWFALLGGTTTHHFVLIDDSYSMSERVAGTSAFDLAEQVLGNIASQAMKQETRQKLTVVRFSKARGTSVRTPAAGASTEEPAATTTADLSSEVIDSALDERLAELRRRLTVTELASEPNGSLQIVKQLVTEGENDQHVVYLISDFRKKEWGNPAELQQLLKEISAAGAEIHLVDCAVNPQPNIAVTEIGPGDDTRAAGVPLFVHIRVTNHGNQIVRKIPVRVRTYSFDPQVVAASRPGDEVYRQDEPPAVLIDEILPGKSVTVRSQVYFPLPGPQVVEARLPDDSVNSDNRRWCVVDLPESEPVLIIDGSADQQHSYYLTSAFAPGPRAATGVQPDGPHPPSFLRDATVESLERYRAIYLLDVPRLDDRGLSNLTVYVRKGGGLGIFLGENVDLQYYNDRFFDEGNGLFPLPLDRSVPLSSERFENRPDLEVKDHPIFSIFLGERNPFIQWVRIEQYIRPRRDWLADKASFYAIPAVLRGGDPLVVDRRFGEGRVVAFMTTAAPQWNNWAHDPSFVVVLLKLHSYLSSPLRRSESGMAGAPLDVRFRADSYRPEISFVTPSESGDARVVIERTAEATGNDTVSLVASIGATFAEQGATDRSGVYEAWIQDISGGVEVRRFAVNVDPAEGSLAKVEEGPLLERLSPVRLQYHRGSDYAFNSTQNPGANRSLLLMCLLLGALFGEQLLAFATGYHPARGVAG